MHELYRRGTEKLSQLDKRDLVRRNATEFLKDRPFDQLDPWVSRLPIVNEAESKGACCGQYGCILLWMYIDYALNYTFPWSTSLRILLFPAFRKLMFLRQA